MKKSEKREIALNGYFNFCMLRGIFFGCLAISFENDTVFVIIISVLALLSFAIGLCLTPYCYRFDAEGVSLCYVFFGEERYLWKNIYEIEVEFGRFDNSFSYRTHGDLTFDLLFPSYSIGGACEGEGKFFMEGYIRRSFRTKRFIKKYWDGEITGYLFEDVKKAIDKRRAKKQKQIASHITDEVVVMEREVRAKARQWLKPFEDELRLLGAQMRSKYVYVTDDDEEYNSRPDKGYKYTLIIDISYPDEREKAHIFSLREDLLYVRLGKTAYRGVENGSARELIEAMLADKLK